MKRNLLFLFSFLFIGFILFSCEKEAVGVDKLKQQMIGKWQLIELLASDPGYNINQARLCDKRGWRRFNKDGTYEIYNDCTEETSFGKWFIDSESYLNFSDDKNKWNQRIESIDDDTLILKSSGFSGGYYNSYYRVYQKMLDGSSISKTDKNPRNDLIVGTWRCRYFVSGERYQAISRVVTFNGNNKGDILTIYHYRWNELGTTLTHDEKEKVDFKWEIIEDNLLIKESGLDYSEHEIRLLDSSRLDVTWYWSNYNETTILKRQ